MDMTHWLFLPDEALDDLDLLSQLSADQVGHLRDFFDSSEFRTKYDFFLKVATLLGIGDETAAKLCTFINHVQRQRVKYTTDGKAALAELNRFLQKAEGSRGERAKGIIDRIRNRSQILEKLFSDLPTYDFTQKVHGLETGPLPHLQSFRAYCDMRPVYDVPADEIVKSFPIITFCLVTHSSATDESKEVLVQLTEEDLDEILKQFTRLRKKLDKLKSFDSALVTIKKE